MPPHPSRRDKFSRHVPVEAVGRAPTGAPARYRLTVTEPPLTRADTAALSLAKRHLPLLRARRVMETLQQGDAPVLIDLPQLDDPAAFEAELRRSGITAERLASSPDASPPSDAVIAHDHALTTAMAEWDATMADGPRMNRPDR